MAKKNKKKFKISREDLNVKINEYLEKGGKITKLECIIPERTGVVTQESQRMGSGINIKIDQDFYTRGTSKEQRK
jgi:Mg2+/Co2+ transporter CorB